MIHKQNFVRTLNRIYTYKRKQASSNATGDFLYIRKKEDHSQIELFMIDKLAST